MNGKQQLEKEQVEELVLNVPRFLGESVERKEL
jgi:hypothetical protein